jgi:hypothetical protein
MDLVLANLQQGRSLQHLRIEDFADSEAEEAHLQEVLRDLRDRLGASEQARIMADWLQAQ